MSARLINPRIAEKCWNGQLPTQYLTGGPLPLLNLAQPK